MTTTEVNELFDCLDKDRSGSVSFDEFLEALRVSIVFQAFVYQNV